MIRSVQCTVAKKCCNSELKPGRHCGVRQDAPNHLCHIHWGRVVSWCVLIEELVHSRGRTDHIVFTSKLSGHQPSTVTLVTQTAYYLPAFQSADPSTSWSLII